MNVRTLGAAAVGFVLVALAWKPLITQRDVSTNYYEIETRLGKMVVRLYDETPLHRDNFAKLVAEQFYDSTTFHRVMRGFMIQGGDPNSKDSDPMNDGDGDPGYTVPAEISPDRVHRRGALAAARQPDQVNPERRSSGSQFYIVHGRPFPAVDLDQIETQIQRIHPDFAFDDSLRAHYLNVGGAPFLDMQYTVFGELVEGFDVLDAIANVETPKRLGRGGPLADRPIESVRMFVRPLENYEPQQ